MIAGSLAVFVTLYAILIVVDVWLMRRYARLDPVEPQDASGVAATPAQVVTY
jgi:cytochrome bd-type quinol oxidase subunit 1